MVSDRAERVMDRRRILAAALAGSGAMLPARRSTARAGAATVQRASSVPPAGSDLGAIDHVVFLMMENRSFDHYYGTYPAARGFDDHPERSLGAFSQPFPANTTRPPLGRLLPFHLDSTSGAGACTHDLSHEWACQHRCRNGGAMDAFVTTHSEPVYEGLDHGTLTMGYYRRADLPFYYALADAFTLGDGYHCSVLGPTHPNRLMAMSGTLDPDGRHGGPVVVTNPSEAARFSVGWPTMPEVLEDAGISWKVYNPPGAIYQPTSPEVMAVADSVLPYFSQYRHPASSLYEKAFTPLYPDDLARDVAAGSLPQVSWIAPPVGYDEHPPAPPALGEWFTGQLLRILTSNPAVWSRTVLFHMYDENDGFFDHVPPPVAPPGTPGEHLTVHPLPDAAAGEAGPIGLGYRVPLLVISPFSRGGRICPETFDHTSQLRFLEARFGVHAPNLSAWRRRAVGDLTATVATVATASTRHGVPPLRYPDHPSAAALAALGCEVTDVLGLRDDQPAYPVPAVQAMPHQEAPRRRA